MFAGTNRIKLGIKISAEELDYNKVSFLRLLKIAQKKLSIGDI